MTGWKGGCEYLVGFASESKISSDVSTAGLLKFELVSKTVEIESSEFICGELDEQLGLKTGKGEEVKSEIDIREWCQWRLDR